MEPQKKGVSNQKVFRDVIKEHRGHYFVVYKPADVNSSLASVSLVFPEVTVDVSEVRRAMEQELAHWLNRFAVPVVVSAFDAKDDVIRFSDEPNNSHLTGYVDAQSRKLVQWWGLMKDEELPSEQKDADYLERAYQEVPFRLQEEVREEIRRKARTTGRIIRLFVFFVATVPVLIELIAWATWLGHVLAGLSVTTGLYKIGKAMGWLRPTQREKEEAEKMSRMEHYFYHCERNPEAFNRLKCENFERESIEQTRAEAETLRKNHK